MNHDKVKTPRRGEMYDHGKRIVGFVARQYERVRRKLAWRRQHDQKLLRCHSLNLPPHADE